jgi:hypothetical protein
MRTEQGIMNVKYEKNCSEVWIENVMNWNQCEMKKNELIEMDGIELNED